MFFFIFCENFHKIFSARQSFRLKINDEIPKNRTFFKKNAIFIFSARKKLGIFPEFFRIRFLFKKSADRAVAFLQKSKIVFLQIFFFFTFSFLSTDTVTLKYFLFFFFSYIFFSFTFLLKFFLA